MADRCGLTRWAVLTVLMALLSGGGGSLTLAAAAAGENILNRAGATYLPSPGSSSNTISNTTSTVVAPISAVALTPDDVAVSGFIRPDPVIVKDFTLINRANRDDRFLITAASVSAPATLLDLYFDLDGNGAVDPADLLIVVGTTTSPMLAADAGIDILLRYSAAGLPDGTVVTTSISALSQEPGSINGVVSDQGTRLDEVGANALFTHPTDPGRPPLKTVNGLPRVIALSGEEVTFRIAFANSGTDPGLNTLLTDALPGGLTYVAGSMVLDGTPQTDAAGDDAADADAGGTTVRFASVAPAATHEFLFRASVDAGVPRGTLVENRATIVADGTDPRDSSPVELLLNPFGRLFDSASGSPVRGGEVSLLTGPPPGTLLALPPLSGSGAPPNIDNINPFFSDGDGRYAFLLDASQIGTPGTPVTYFLEASSRNYLTRRLQMDVGPASPGLTPVYDLTITALDGLPLSDPLSGSLVPGPIHLTDAASIGFDIPLVSDSILSIIKNADKSHVQVGESVGYRVRVSNQGSVDVTGLTVTDALPRFLDLVEGTSRRINSRGPSDLEPVQSGNRVVFDLGDLAVGEHVEFSYRARVAPGAPAEAMQNKATATGVLATGDETSAGPARAVIFVKQGIFSFQQVLIGRVFEDRDRSGIFDGGDLPLAGVRVVLDNGMSSTTDNEGLYSLPSVPEGARMIGLDSSTYPPGYCPVDTHRVPDRGAFRLLRTPLQGGSLLKQNFLLEAGKDCPGEPEDTEVPPAANEAAPEADNSLPPAPSTVVSETESTLTEFAVQTEELPLLAPGQLTVLDPPDGFVSMTGALDLEIRTHRQGQVRVRVNDVQVSGDRIGQTILDDRNQLATFGFVGIPLRPGPNRVVVDALHGDGSTGGQQELTVYGRGPVELLRLQPGADSLPADGRSHTTVQVELVDAWGHPAQDARVLLTASAGVLSDGDGARAGPALDVSTQDGIGRVELAAELATGPAHLEASYGDLSTDTSVSFVPAQRPRLLVGMAELTLGASDSDPGIGDDPAVVEDGAEGRVALFYQGSAPMGTLLTAAYDSDRHLNRTTDTDRLFELDPLEKRYPVMGDSSSYFEQAQANSRGYFKLEKNRSYLMWGDFQPALDTTQFAENNRKLTGLQLNLENAGGDRLTLSAAEPDHVFAREVIPGAGISGLYQLAHSPLVPGSEQITIEVHDRRNADVILSQETLVRGVDYDIDTLAGTILFKRPIGTFSGSDFDLVEVVILYEFEPGDFDGLAWNGRGRKSWNGGNTRLGFSVLGEEQDGGDDFHLAGTDLLQRLPHDGTLALEVAASDGRPLNLGNASLGDNPDMDGMAVRGEYSQSFAALRGPLRASFQDVDEGFLNPFGGSVTPGNRRVTVGWEPLLTRRITMSVELQDEENETKNVDNSRTTGSVSVKVDLSDTLEVTAGYDHRDFDDRISDDKRSSDLVSAGFNWRPTKRWQVALRREQNVSGNADPSFPDSTFLNVGFQQNEDLRYFLRVRDSGGAIETIADVSAAGITPPRSETEVQLGAETRLGTYSTMSARYQIESGINGSDSFAVVGLGTRLPVKETLSVDFRGEAGLSVDGPGDTFESLSTGLSWLPNDRLRTTLRYELRDAAGFGQTLTAAAVGKPGDDITMLARLTASDARQSGQGTTKVHLMTGLAWRPLLRDDFGLLFAWNHRDHKQGSHDDDVRTLSDTLSADGVLELSRRARWFGKLAFSYADDKPSGLPSVSTTTTLVQSRLEYRLGGRWDVAAEVREHYLWQDSLRRDHLGIECGFWATGDLRVALGYAFTGADPLQGAETATQNGLYLNLTSKMNGILELLRRKP